jgi:hypothetical protein
MSAEYFSILGLTPGRYEPAEITRRFQEERGRLLERLDDPGWHAESRSRLEELHVAYRVLRDPRRQAECLAAVRLADDAPQRLTRLIEASLEDGLLRYSRRQAILAEARRLGLSDFHAHVLIAQVQFGGGRASDMALERIHQPPNRPAPPAEGGPRRGVRLAGIGLLALALVLALLRWAGV